MSIKQQPLRVCLDARLISGTLGGIEQFVIGMANGLSKLTDGDEEYLFLAYETSAEWIEPYVHGACRMLYGDAATRRPAWAQKLKALPGARLAFRKLGSLLARGQTTLLAPPRSDGTIEDAGIDLMHFTMQSAFLTELPNIYHPWDLQHVHLPQFFSDSTRQTRETFYGAFCHQARMVAVATTWTKRDVMQHFQLAGDKVQVVPIAPVLTAYPTPTNDDIDAVKQKFSLPDAFIFYPAQTWAHKNHIELMEALALLRDRHGLIIPFVSSGHRNDFYTHIERRVRELEMADQVQFLGFVTPLELQCLYKLCRGVVFPSKFEGWGMPLAEAFQAGAPVVCSNATSLPDLAANAAVLFEPDNVEEMAKAIQDLWTDAELRRTLIERGRKRVALFSWEHTARLFRAHYRRIANRSLNDEDRALLAAPPLV